MFNYKTIHIELSSKCVLKCPRCPRTELNLDSVNQEVTLEDFKSGFPTSVINKIENFLFCGEVGDPVYATEFLEIIEYIKQNSSSRIRIVTNGSYKKDEWWKRLGSALDYNDRITFSIDGWDNASNNLYRVNSDFDSIINGIKTLRANSSCCIRWSAIYFAFNQDKISELRKMATELGCDQFQYVKSSKFDDTYSVNGVDLLKPRNEFVASSLVYEPVNEILRKHDFVPLVDIIPQVSHPWAKCLNYKKELFIGINGLLTPCPWFNNGYQDNSFIKEHHDRLSIRKRPFFEILDDTELWNQLVKSFDIEPLKICQIKCKNAQQ